MTDQTKVDVARVVERPKRLMMPNGEQLECDYPNAPDWARSWSIRYPDNGQIGTTQEQDWELVERYGLTALFAAFAATLSAENERLRAEVEEARRNVGLVKAEWAAHRDRALVAEARADGLAKASCLVVKFWSDHGAWGDFASLTSAAAKFAPVADAARAALAQHSGEKA